jgi:hypothetical protein
MMLPSTPGNPVHDASIQGRKSSSSSNPVHDDDDDFAIFPLDIVTMSSLHNKYQINQQHILVSTL